MLNADEHGFWEEIKQFSPLKNFGHVTRLTFFFLRERTTPPVSQFLARHTFSPTCNRIWRRDILYPTPSAHSQNRSHTRFVRSHIFASFVFWEWLLARQEFVLNSDNVVLSQKREFVDLQRGYISRITIKIIYLSCIRSRRIDKGSLAELWKVRKL